ncbi:MAG: hypothetical protein IJ656_01655 [Bacilli bacterium]|nr:hypothetical protein [Bacilli bacterium]
MIKKKRKLPLIVGGLAAISLLSVGFANWVLGAQLTNQSVGNFQVVVGDVSDNRLKMFASLSDNSVVFDAVGTSAGLISASNPEATENMTFAGTLKIGWEANVNDAGTGFLEGAKTSYNASNKPISDAFAKVKFNLALSSESSSKQSNLNNAIATYAATNNSSIVNPIDLTDGFEQTVSSLSTNSASPTSANWTTGYVNYSLYKRVDTDGNYIEIYFTFGFGYNEFFSSLNPTQFVEDDANHKYIDDKTVSETNYIGAISRLQNLHLLNDASFDVTVSTL